MIFGLVILDSVGGWVVKMIADFEDLHHADAMFIDFGYGAGPKLVGNYWRNWTAIQFGVDHRSADG